jgi:formate dehydrogenase major subunit
MPCASHVEKEGTFTNTQRLVQWRDKALEPPGDARSELWFIHHLTKRVRAHYADSTDAKDWAIQNLHWDYEEHGHEQEPLSEDILREINGYEVATGAPVPASPSSRPTARRPAAAGSTPGSSRTASTSPAGATRATSRSPEGPSSPEWGWAWPANRRMLYNRASADPEGRPWSERKKYVWWDEDAGKWTGYDVPDFPVDKRPDYRAPEEGGKGMDAISGSEPFIMMGRRAGLAVHAERPARRPAAVALRARRIARVQQALPGHRGQPGGGQLGTR